MPVPARLRLSGTSLSDVMSARRIWTLIGCLAVPLWATWPSLAIMTLGSMPLFQYLALLFFSGAAALALFSRNRTGAAMRYQSGLVGGARTSVWLAGAMVGLGLLVSDIFFILALDHISVAQANLVLYLWPIMVVGLCAAFRFVRLRAIHVMGVFLGLAGAALVIGLGGDVPSLTGIALALAGGLTWAIYVVFRVWQGEDAPEAMALGLTLSALIALGLHLGFETSVMPPATAFAGTVLAGIMPLAFGNLAWDHGMRKGDKVLLATMAYATPLVGALLLAIFGLAEVSAGLFLGAVLVGAGGVAASR